MHQIFQIDELLEYIFDFISCDRPSLVCCTRVSKLFWERSARRLWRELPGGLVPLNLLMELPWYPTDDDNPKRPLIRIELYSAFIREVFGTVLPRHPGASSSDRYLKAGLKVPISPVRFELRAVDIGIETEAALRFADVLLSPSIQEFNVYLPRTIPRDDFLVFLRSLPSKIPDVQRLSLLTAETLVWGEQEDVARMLARLTRLKMLRMILEVGDELLETLGSMALDSLIISFTSLSEVLPYRSLTTSPVNFRSLRDLDLKGQAHSCAELMDRMCLPALECLDLSIFHFQEDSMMKLCEAISRSASSVRMLHIRSLASKYKRGGRDRPFPVAIFYPLSRCSMLEDVTLIGGYHGRDRLLWEREDLLWVAQSWAQLTRLALIAQPWHPRGFQPRLTLQDLVPLVNYCRSLVFLSIAVDMAAPTRSIPNLRPADTMSMIHLDAYSIAPGTKDMEVTVANFLIRMWPNMRLKVDPDSMGSRNELDWFADHFNERRTSGLTMMTKLWGLPFQTALVDEFAG